MSIFDFDQAPDRYAVMGNPVAHSKSPRIHALFAKQTRQRMEYTAIQVDPGGFDPAVSHFVASGGKGLNVTVPFKEDAYRLVESRSDRAQAAGAVNTIIVENGHLRGDNTDGVGLIRDILRNHGGDLRGKRLLLLGTGGAARGILAPLLTEGVSQLWLVNRTAAKARDLALQFRALGPVAGGGFDGLKGRQFDFVINATTASLQDTALPLPADILSSKAWCYDLMYGKPDNVFSNWARLAGAQRVLDGLGMLVEQAAESFYLWRGVLPDTAPVLEVLRAG